MPTRQRRTLQRTRVGRVLPKNALPTNCPVARGKHPAQSKATPREDASRVLTRSPVSPLLCRRFLRRRGARRGTRCCPRGLGPLLRCRSRRRCRLPRSFPKRLHVSTGYSALALPRCCPAVRRRRPASDAARRLLSAGRCAGRQRHALCAGGTAARPLCARAPAPALGCRGGRRNCSRRGRRRRCVNRLASSINRCVNRLASRSIKMY